MVSTMEHCARQDCHDLAVFVVNPDNPKADTPACWAHLGWAMTVAARSTTVSVKIL